MVDNDTAIERVSTQGGANAELGDEPEHTIDDSHSEKLCRTARSD